MSNVTPITARFDRDVDTVLLWMHEPTTAPIPLRIVHPAAETEVLPAYRAVLPGPATELDAVPLPQPRAVWNWAPITWAFVLGVTVGVAYMIVMTGLSA